MKYLPLIWAGVWRKPARTVFTFLSIVVAFTLLGVLAGVNIGFGHLIETARADRLLVDRRYGPSMPYSYLEQIKAVPGVVSAAPSVTLPGYYQERTNFLGFGGVRADWFKNRPEYTITPEQIEALAQNRTAAVVTVATATKMGFKVGDRIPIQSTIAQKDGSKVWTFDIIAIVDDRNNPGTTQNFLVNFDYVDQARAAELGTVTRFTVIIDDPNRAVAISRDIDAMFINASSGTRTASERSGAESGLQSLGDTNFMINAIGGSVLFMLLFLTGNTAMQSVRERIPEFGTLKALGFSDVGVFAIVLAESLVVFALGAGLGLAIGKGLIELTRKMNVPPLLMPWSVVGVGVVLSLLAAMLSALIPAHRVQRLSIVNALSNR